MTSRRNSLLPKNVAQPGICVAEGAVLCVFVSREITCGVWLAEVVRAEAWWRLDMRGRQPLKGLMQLKDIHSVHRTTVLSKVFAASAVK